MQRDPVVQRDCEKIDQKFVQIRRGKLSMFWLKYQSKSGSEDEASRPRRRLSRNTESEEARALRKLINTLFFANRGFYRFSELCYPK